jgi:SAM-dependent methyltransferase
MKLLIKLLMLTRFAQRNALSPGNHFMGSFASKIMTKINRMSSQDAATRLGISRDHCVLELGPGSGWGIEVMAAAKPKRIVGVEISKLFRKELAALEFDVKPEIYGDDAIDMSAFLDDASVDRLLAVNVVYFLNPLPKYADELFRVMAPGSRGILACKPKLIQNNKDDIFVNKDMNVISETFRTAGFKCSMEEIDLGNSLSNYIALHISK